MKKGIILSTLLLVAGIMFAQQPVITFAKVEHDFGKINEADGRVTTIFEFKNEGMEPLVLSNVRASCGCTTPSWTKTPIEPGQTGNISVTYNPNGRPGRFQKTVTITSNATEPTKKIYIKGEVIPKAAQPVNKYPVKMGDIALSSNTLDFGTVMMGKSVVKSIDYANLDQETPVKVAVSTENAPCYAEATLPEIEKGKNGQIHVRFDSQIHEIYGPQEYTIHVLANGAKKSDENKVKLTVNVEEDFSQMTQEELQAAPIVEVERHIDLGTVAVGKKVKKQATIANVGANTLMIRRVINSTTDVLNCNAGKGVVKSGKKGTLNFEVFSKEPGSYTRLITLMTNDPKNSKVKLTVTWKAE